MKARRTLALVLVLTLLLSLVPVMSFSAATSPIALKFDFGTVNSAVQSGYTQVTELTNYSAETGYGWLNDPRITVTAGDSGNSNALNSDWVTGNMVQDGADITAPAVDAEGNYIHYTYPTFVVDLPNGIYTIKTVQGDYSTATKTGAIVEDIRAFAPVYSSLVNTTSVQTERQTNAGSFKTTSKDVVVYDGQLTVQITGSNSRLNALEITSKTFAEDLTPNAKPTLFICADSLAYGPGSDATSRQAGWGAHIAEFLTDGITVNNTSMGGLAARDFIADARFNDYVIKNVKPGDYVIIQFGHNDCTPSRPNRFSQPSEFKTWLAKYVTAVRAFGATPVFMTPPNRGYTENGNKVEGKQFINSFEPWTAAQREVAAEMDVELLEMNKYTIDYYSAIGWTRYCNEVSTDFTHFKNSAAATTGAQMISYLMTLSDCGLNQYATGTNVAEVPARAYSTRTLDNALAAAAEIDDDGYIPATYASLQTAVTAGTAAKAAAEAKDASINRAALDAARDAILSAIDGLEEQASWYFDFGAGEVAEGFIGVTNGAYSAATGYGWSSTSSLTTGASTSTVDPIYSDYVKTSATNRTFNVDLANGEYMVTVISGDADAATTVGYKVERNNRVSRQGWNSTENSTINVAAGSYDVNTFDVSVYDGQMNFIFINNGAKINAILIDKMPSRDAGDKPVVYVIGDSVADSYGSFQEPQKGWGQLLPNYFDPEKVEVQNWAIGARTADRNIIEGRLEMVLEQLRPGDYTIFNFGFNEKTTGNTSSWQGLVRNYAEGTLQRGATPILVSSTASLRTQDPAALSNMRNGLKTVATSLNVPFIDNYEYTTAQNNARGALRSQAYYLYVQPGIYTYKTGSYDYTKSTVDQVHMQKNGAIVAAKYVASEIAKLDLSISDAVVIPEDPTEAPAVVDTLYPVSISGTSATISWLPVDDTDYYVVRYRTQGSSNWTETAAVDYPQATITLSGLSAANKYEISVLAENAAGSTASEILTIPQASDYANIIPAAHALRLVRNDLQDAMYTEDSMAKFDKALNDLFVAISGDAAAADAQAAYNKAAAAYDALVTLVTSVKTFDFGSGALYTAAAANEKVYGITNQLYSADAGYGWIDNGIEITAADSAYNDASDPIAALRTDYVTAEYVVGKEATIYPSFQVDVPNGKYLVRVQMGDYADVSNNGLRINGYYQNIAHNCVAAFWDENYLPVEVTDGKLVFDMDGFLCKLNFLQIYALGESIPNTYKFDFGTDAPDAGWTQVTSANVYGAGSLYGFVALDGVTYGDNANSTTVTGGTFKVKLPAGDYTIKTTAGDPSERTNIGYTMNMASKKTAGNVNASANGTATSYPVAIVNGELEIQFLGTNAKIMSIEITPMAARSAGSKPTLYLLGDSTVTSSAGGSGADRYIGWGSQIGSYLENITISNQAVAGRGIRGFYTENRIDPVLTAIKPGDFLGIQFGHNDANTANAGRYSTIPEFKEFLTTACVGALQRGATPVLITVLSHLRNFNEANPNDATYPLRPYTEDEFIPKSFQAYVQATLEVAEELGIPVYDLNSDSYALITEKGPTWMLENVIISDGVHPKNPDGAKIIARMVADGLADIAVDGLSEQVLANADLLAQMRALAADAAALKASSFTADSYAAVVAALAPAQEVLATSNAKQIPAKAAFEALSEAMDGLTSIVSAEADKAIYAPDEQITVTVLVPSDVEKVYLTSEAGVGLATTREKVDNGDGTATWTLTFGLGSMGDRALNVYADGEDTGVDVELTIGYDKTPVVVYAVSAPFSAKANENFTLTIKTGTSVAKVRLFNEAGNGLMPISCEYEDQGSVRVWTYVTNVATAGIREFTVKAAGTDGVYLDNNLPKISFVVA